ncbi:MAG: potassium channel family protein [Actinomycetota bacterium]
MDYQGALWPRLRWPLAGWALLLILGLTGFTVLGFLPLDALYMTVLAVTTVGFSSSVALSQAGKLLTVGVAISGVVLTVTTVAVITSSITEGRLRTSSRRRKMEKRIEQLSGHYIICAYGRVGRAVARQFKAEGVEFVVIDADEDMETRMQSDEVNYIVADSTSEEVLRKAGIAGAAGLVSAVDSDVDNVYITLTARALNPDLFIVARAGEPETPDRLHRAGANRVISPYVTSGRHMALTTLRPRVVDYLEIAAGGTNIRVEELRIEPKSSLIGRQLGDICGGTVPLFLRRQSGKSLVKPSPGEVIEAGDVLLILGEPAELRPIEGA